MLFAAAIDWHAVMFWLFAVLTCGFAVAVLFSAMSVVTETFTLFVWMIFRIKEFSWSARLLTNFLIMILHSHLK